MRLVHGVPKEATKGNRYCFDKVTNAKKCHNLEQHNQIWNYNNHHI